MLRGLDTPAPAGFCPSYWDEVMCWPATPPRTVAVLKCFEWFNGLKYEGIQNASRVCADGKWENYTDYSRCLSRDVVSGNVTATADVTSLLYLGGYSLSLAALSLAVFVFVYFKDLRCLRNTIHTNLMCTYILSACIWILNLVLQLSAQTDQMSCMVLVVCLHYFYLTNFFWMLVEGLYLYMLVVETFTAENIKLKVYTTIGWGAPAVFIIVWIITRCLVTVDRSTDTDELGSLAAEAPMCPWVREHSVDWIHKAPAIAGLALNLFFLVRIMWVLITKLRSANTLETEQYRKATKALVVLIPLLGITYIVVICGPTDGWFSVTFDYIRAILLSTQGFTVALFYCFLNTEVRHAIRYHVERWKNGRSIGGTRRRGASYSKDWSPRSRTESIRLTI